MSDEGMHGDPMTEIEVINATRNLAKGVWTLYEALQSEGFSESDALRLCCEYVRGIATPR